MQCKKTLHYYVALSQMHPKHVLMNFFLSQSFKNSTTVGLPLDSLGKGVC